MTVSNHEIEVYFDRAKAMPTIFKIICQNGKDEDSQQSIFDVPGL
jgi:hypothetical protein